MRASSLSYNTVAVNREIDSIYDAILDVRENLVSIATVAGLDVNALVAEIQDAKDFTGIAVVAGSVANWDSVNKILTVPTLKGDQGTQGLKGDAGLTVVGPQGSDGQKGDRGIQGLTGATGATGGVGPQGIQGLKGDTGSDLTVEQIVYNGNGTFTWQFSDGTSFTTPNLIGPQGLQGSKGAKGDTGISVHHTKGTSTTDSEGNFGAPGEKDTYTMYGDAAETVNLGWFIVTNGDSAYGYAVKNGYTGTESEYYNLLISSSTMLATLSDISDEVTVASAQVAADRVIVEGAKNTATTSASSASSSATAASVSAASASSNATIATTKAGEANTSATNAAISATTATTSATTATTKANDAAASATTAVNAVNSIGTSVTNAATSATSAANSATSASSSATTATTKASEASTSAASAAASATTATTKASAASTSAATASTKASEASANVTASASNASAALASKNAAAVSEASALTYKNSASTSATTATTKASEASVSAASALVSETNANTSKNTAATSATTATTKASEASTSASNASTSAANASTSASAASVSASTSATKATEAATSASTALVYKNDVSTMKLAIETIYDTFDDRFLGTKTTNPSVDNDGNALLDGAMYFDTTTNAMKVYDVGTGTWYSMPQIYLNSLLDVELTSLTTGHMLIWNGTKWVNTENTKVGSAQFEKPNTGVLFTKVSPSSFSIPIGLKVTIGSTFVETTQVSTLTLALNLVGSSKTAGTDYYVYAKENGSFYISASDSITTDKLIGGFHYGLVGEAETLTGNKTEADMVKIRGINEYSFWDLKYRPVASPKGMVNIGKKWYDIYLLNSEHITNGTSKAGATIAGGMMSDGRAIPKIPLEFGGNNTLTYGKLSWFQAIEIAKSASKHLLNYSEFTVITYGVTEQVSSLTDGYETVMGRIEHYPNLTSKYGIEQATGTQWVLGNDLVTGSYGYTDIGWKTGFTASRGDIYSVSNSPDAVIMGGFRDTATHSGSRASNWGIPIWTSLWSVGCRFACDHIELV